MSDPIAWIGPSGELMLDQVFQDWSRGRFAEDVNGYKPLYRLIESTTETLECVGINQYAMEIENKGRRIRYEAPSVEGVRELMCAHDDYNIGITPAIR